MEGFLSLKHKKLSVLLIVCMLFSVFMPAIAIGESVPVSGVALDYSELSLTSQGEARLLTATILPLDASNQAVTWSSSDESIAIVEDGLVNPIMEGEATVTVTTLDGGFTDICYITVRDQGLELDTRELDASKVAASQNVKAGYTAESWAILQKALEFEVTDETTQEEVDIAEAAINAAIEGLVAVEDWGDQEPEQMQAQSSEPVMGINSMGENVEHPLISIDSDEIVVDYEINEGYTWSYKENYSKEGYDAYLAGNSFTNQANVSNIAFTVSEPGVFSFDYRLSTPSSGSFYALYYNKNEPINSLNYSSADNYGSYTLFRGVVDWTDVEFTINQEDLNEQGQATVYIAYYRNGTSISNDNMVSIANVCFISGDKTLTLNVDGVDYGHVSVEGENYSSSENILNYYSGDSISLTAVANEGSRFYGWVDEGKGKFLTTDETYSFMISEDTILKAVFAPEGSYSAHRNGIFYTGDNGLSQALTESQSGDLVVMLENQILVEDTNVPTSVKLYIPYSADLDEDGNVDGVTTAGSTYQASTIIATPDKTYRTLTVNNGSTLTVDGTIIIGGVIGYPNQFYQGHTSGWHGRIINDGNIIINNGATLDCWGFITGSGSVEALSGAKVYEPFIVFDFAGGMNTAYLYFDGQSPFKQYSMQNIENNLVINSGASLYGRCNLWASSSYNKTDIVYIGENGLYELASGATFYRTYDENNHINTNTDIGKTTYNFDGGMKLNYLSMPIWGVAISTADVEFPIPYNIDIVLSNGNYLFDGRSKLMPGATLSVEDEASLTVTNTLFVLNGLIQSDMSGHSYPSTEILKSSEFSASGQLFVNGSMTIKDGVRFGGLIQTTQADSANPATVTIEAEAIVNSANVQDGAVGLYDVNTSVFELPAQANIYDASNQTYRCMNLLAGNTYTSHNNDFWTVDNYTMTYVENCGIEDRSEDIPVIGGKYHKWTTTTVPLNETRVGSWLSEINFFTVNVIRNTVYDLEDTSRVTVSGEFINDNGGTIGAYGNIVFNVNLTEVGKGYVYQVSYESGTDESIVINPDTEGNYTIANVGSDITISITSCKLGDINQDEAITNIDLVLMRKLLTESIEATNFQLLASDTNLDGKIDNTDLVLLRKNLAGIYNF